MSRAWIGLVAVLMGYACFEHGGVTSHEWGFCLVAIAVCGVGVLSRGEAPAMHPVLLWGLALCALYVAFQLAPLPPGMLRAIDPARAELTAGTWASLSVAPSLTLAHLQRLLGYIAVFFTARELSARGWWLAAPVIAVGTLEAILGLFQAFTGAGRAYGTYMNPNHFAALMHMALPMAAMAAATAMRRQSAARVALSCLLMACLAVIFLAALYSLSRMGLITVLACGAIIGLLAFRFRLAAAVPLTVLAIAVDHAEYIDGPHHPYG